MARDALKTLFNTMKPSVNEDDKWLVILQTIPDLLFLIDKNGRFEPFLNQDRKRPLFTFDHYTGKTISELFEQPLADQFMQAVQETIRTGSCEQEYQMGKDDGRYFSARYSRLNDEEVICSVRDITAQKETENALRRGLEMQQRFCSIIAHDLRGPVSNFLPVLDILTREEVDDATRIDYLEELKKASISTFNLLENLLSWSRLQSCSLQLRPSHFLINRLIEESLELLLPGARQKSITVTHLDRAPLPVYADKNSIQLVLRNLLNNALKFTSREGQITISARSQGNLVEVEVTDTGVGIPEGMTDKIFDKRAFYTTYGTEHEKGSGLGLILAREFLEKNEGQIGVESKEGLGSRFWFTLPAGEAQHCEPEEQRLMNLLPGEHLSGKHILLVDDDLFSQHFGRNLLSSWKMNVDTADNGLQALQLLEEHPYDLILMDIEMPHLNGFDTLGIIREERQLTTPVIALSASVSDLTYASAIAMGFNDYLVKPFKPGELLPKLFQWFRKKYSDTSRLSRSLGNDPALIREMITSFLKITPDYYQELLKAHALEDLETIAKITHKFKSSIALMATREALSNLEEIHTAATDPLHHHELNGLLSFFKNWYPQLCRELTVSLQ